MDYQSKQMVINALVKVINAAPKSYLQRSYSHPIECQNRDVSMQEFNIWMNYVNQVMDISYNHIELNAILMTKITISQLSSQYGVSNTQRIEQIKQELLNLAQIITQY